MTPDQFIAKWKVAELKERSAAQSHFIDLCGMLDEPAPTDADPKGEWYAFERGATKTTGGEGWADLVVYDATFTEDEIVSRAGWGHSTWARGIRLAEEAGAKQLCLFHHDPSHDDEFMDSLTADANDARPGTITAREGQIIDL